MTARAWMFLALALILAGAASIAFFRCESTPPSIEAPEQLVLGREGRVLSVEIADEASGLRSARAKLLHAEGEAVLLETRWAPPGPALSPTGPRRERVELELDAKRLELPEGDAFLELSARDGSWRDRFRGNQAVLRIPVRVDLRPPRVSLESGLTYVRQGGAGVLVYAVSEQTERDGVEVGERFFAGFPLGTGDARRVVLFAVPVDAGPETPVQVVALDRAGNRGTARPAVRIQAQRFPDVELRLSRGFLEGKVVELARAQGLDASDPVALFKEVNETLRARNETRIGELVRDSAARALFQGAFQQMRNSKVTSRFAERRSYLVDGRRVSRATHYGYDLASTAGAPVMAANAGRVLFADELGIYGGCVLVDHGLGLASLYGHLSQIDVASGDTVEKGQTLGRSGQTGLAGGDHLHFAILVGGVYVDPLEWWDEKWVREHVLARLAPATP